MSNKAYRIRTTVGGDDKVVNINLKQGIKTINILSLEINPEDIYEIQTSDYGVIVGRVLANDALGVPNVKVSVFIPLSNEDENDYIISNEYPVLGLCLQPYHLHLRLFLFDKPYLTFDLSSFTFA